MRRPLAAFAILLALSGCQSGTQTAKPEDPFFGRTRIEPPGTGTIAAAGAKDPGYAAPKVQAPGTQSPAQVVPVQQAPQQVPVQQAPVQQGPVQQTPVQNAPVQQTPTMPRSGGVPRPTSMGSATASPSAGLVVQAAGTRGDVISIPASARGTGDRIASRSSAVGASSGGASVPAASTSATSVPTSSPAGAAPERLVQTISPRPKAAEPARQSGAAVLPSSWPSPLPAAAPQGAVNIMDLPPSNSQSSTVQRPSGVVLASATEDVGISKTMGGSAAGRYGYDAKYQWLQGKLEYSQVERTWRLRYIPVDGTTDTYGGSVTLAQTAKLSGLERGDFVEVHGRLVPPQAGSKTFSAGYEISDIKRISP